jgi:hypothetical protein
VRYPYRGVCRPQHFIYATPHIRYTSYTLHLIYATPHIRFTSQVSFDHDPPREATEYADVASGLASTMQSTPVGPDLLSPPSRAVWAPELLQNNVLDNLVPRFAVVRLLP